MDGTTVRPDEIREKRLIADSKKNQVEAEAEENRQFA